jgi:hypothetical protein
MLLFALKGRDFAHIGPYASAKLSRHRYGADMNAMRLVRLDVSNGDPRRPRVHESAVFKLAFSESGRRYYGAVFADTLDDRSVAIVDDDGAVLVWECDLAGGTLQRFGVPIEPWWRPGLDHMTQKQALRMLMGAVDEYAAPAMRVRTSDATDPDGLLVSQLLSRGARCHPDFRTIMDLRQDDETLEAGLRSTMRRHVRWGRKNLTLDFVDAANPDEALFHRFRELHRDVAGRVTRPIESWMASFEAIKAGDGDLILCRENDELVGGTMIADAGDTAVYATGAFDRSRFDKPLAHLPMLTAAVRARDRGRTRFDVGEIYDPGHEVSEKERQIGYFKSGFSSMVSTSLIWTTQAKAAD